MENSKVIEEADEALEHSLMMAIPAPPPPPLPHPPHLTIKETNRDVLKLISRLPSQKQTAIEETKQTAVLTQGDSQQGQAGGGLQIGKYNYTGQAYRFEKAEWELDVSKPSPKVECKTEQAIDCSEKREKVEKELSVRMDGQSPREDKDSILGEESLEREEVKFPSHNYYIMFDRKPRKGRTAPLERRGVGNLESMAKTTYLERKVNNLETEIRKIKNSSGSSFNRSRVDGKMRLDQLLDSILP